MRESLFNDFERQVEKLSLEIRAHYEPYETEGYKFMGDGIINLRRYYEVTPKILWILKEPYADGGGWSISEAFNLSNAELMAPERKLHKSKTWLPVIYSCYAIYNGMIPWDWISYPENDSNVLDSLKNIAIMNILKIPGETTTPPAKLTAGYEKHWEILKKQIETYNPDIVIAGNTLSHFKKHLSLDSGEFDYNYTHDLWLKDGKVYIDCKHPSTTLLSDAKIENYVDGITEIIRVWADKNGVTLKTQPS